MPGTTVSDTVSCAHCGDQSSAQCKTISWGSCYHADCDSAGLGLAREVSDPPAPENTLREAAMQTPRNPKEEGRAGLESSGEACRKRGASAGFWREQEVRRHHALVGR